MNTTINANMYTDAAIAALYRETGGAPPTPARPIVRLGELIRALNVTCEEVAGLTRDSASRRLAERGGLLDEDGGERQSPLAGFLYAVGEDGSIFVEQNDPVTRRRFSVAHELGHFCMHFRPLLMRLSAVVGAPVEAIEAFPVGDMESEPDDQPEGQMVLPLAYAETALLPPLAQMEDEANRFAAELLMPAAVVTELAMRHRRFASEDDLVWRLANELLVSRAAMRWRLRALGWLQIGSGARRSGHGH